jgi:hypothetical protein
MIAGISPDFWGKGERVRENPWPGANCAAFLPNIFPKNWEYASNVCGRNPMRQSL